MQKFIAPGLVVLFGVIWLLNALDIIPPFNFIWTALLAGSGIGILASNGWNKAGFPWGVFFLLTAVFSVLRQSGRLDLKVELPVLVISIGLLHLINHTNLIPPAPPKA
jgi:hypothetical protein